MTEQKEEGAEVDFHVENHGSIFVIQPMNEEATAHLRVNVGPEAQWYGGGLVVEHRFAYDLAQALINEGFTVN